MNNSNLDWEVFLKLKKSPNSLIPLNVVTGSMEPLIPVGSKVVVDKDVSYKTNDIIVFWHNKKLIVHILWSINSKVMKNGNEVFVTRSLRSQLLDTSVTREQVLGKVVNFKLSFWDLLNLYVFKRVRKY